jgi:hypothetical protein
MFIISINKSLIDMSNHLLDNDSIYDTNHRIGNDRFKLKQTLSRLEIEAANSNISSFQLSLNDILYNYFDLNKFKHDCNMYLS